MTMKNILWNAGQKKIGKYLWQRRTYSGMLVRRRLESIDDNEEHTLECWSEEDWKVFMTTKNILWNAVQKKIRKYWWQQRTYSGMLVRRRLESIYDNEECTLECWSEEDWKVLMTTKAILWNVGQKKIGKYWWQRRMYSGMLVRRRLESIDDNEEHTLECWSEEDWKVLMTTKNILWNAGQKKIGKYWWQRRTYSGMLVRRRLESIYDNKECTLECWSEEDWKVLMTTKNILWNVGQKKIGKYWWQRRMYSGMLVRRRLESIDDNKEHTLECLSEEDWKVLMTTKNILWNAGQKKIGKYWWQRRTYSGMLVRRRLESIDDNKEHTLECWSEEDWKVLMTTKNILWNACQKKIGKYWWQRRTYSGGAKDAACTWSLCSIRSGSTNCIDFPCPLESGPSSRFWGQPATGTRRVAGTTHTESGRHWEQPRPPKS